MADLTGQYFGSYKLDMRVGTGSTANIYKAFDKTLSRWVAVKVMPLQAQAPSEAWETLLARFRREARAIAQLRHPNIITVYDYDEANDWAYMVMEYVPGGSLNDWLRPNSPFGGQQALDVVIPVALALAFAHEQGIIHRDIKPANILLPSPDWPLLTDFGLAKMQHPSLAELTKPGQVLGNDGLCRSRTNAAAQIDARADIYALGIVLYELLTGQPPFRRNRAFDALVARLTDPPLPLQQAIRGCVTPV
ncbi:MAG: serine/threonine-protein kinase [Anaerolineae bacterium]